MNQPKVWDDRGLEGMIFESQSGLKREYGSHILHYEDSDSDTFYWTLGGKIYSLFLEEGREASMMVHQSDGDGHVVYTSKLMKNIVDGRPTISSERRREIADEVHKQIGFPYTNFLEVYTQKIIEEICK